jgi:hypothetical protein
VPPAFIEALFAQFSDATVYFVMAAVGSLLFLIRLLFMLVGLDHGGDFDTHVDVDGGGFEAHGGDFSLFSMLSILSFLMGAGWLGLACRLEWGLGPVVTAISASAFGFFLMLLSSFGMWQMRKFNAPGRYDVQAAVGHIGRVYLTIPPKGKGQGQVEISVDGRRKVLAAVTLGAEALESFASVKAVGIQEGEVLIVERA